MMEHGKVPILSGGRLTRVVRKKNVTDTFYRYNDKRRHFYERPITIGWNQNYLFKVLLLKHDIGMHDLTLH